ncbi:uncharacterized protein ACR2FA_011667 [Aphomia sociella]
MRGTLAVLLLVFVPLCVCRSVNYCGSRMCGHTNSHTFCQYPIGPSHRCTGYMDAGLSGEEKARIMARLNRRRNEAACGRLRRMPPAGNMLKLRWVEELAREAQRWADQCRPPSTPDERDTCRDLYSMSVGQCVTSVVGEAPGLRAESMIDMWYMQSILYKGNVTSYYAPSTNYSFYGDFAQVIWASSYMVGCGRSRFMVPQSGRLRSVERLVCNFAPRGPSPGRALWIPAAPATACPPRSVPDANMPGLCNYQYNLDESNDVDNTMTLEEHVLLNTVLEVEYNKALNYMGSIDELYLTKIAIATMENSMTTSYYNSIHKRDVVEKTFQNEIPNMYNVKPDYISNEKSNSRIHMSIYGKTTANVLKARRKNIIGRPKSYNIEELNDVGGTIIAENHHDVPDESSNKIERELYGGYDYSEKYENAEEVIRTNIFSDKKLTNLGNNFTTSEIDRTLELPISSVNINFEEYSKMALEFLNKNESLELYLAELSMNNSTADKSLILAQKSEEDFLSDPETVRELQEALDRMEHSLETSTIGSSKVRRDLREPPPEIDESDQNKHIDKNPHSVENTQRPIEEIARNKSPVENAPMLNMVLRYMPYLKPYEQEIIDSVASRANVLYCSSIVVVIILCL